MPVKTLIRGVSQLDITSICKVLNNIQKSLKGKVCLNYKTLFRKNKMKNKKLD